MSLNAERQILNPMQSRDLFWSLVHDLSDSTKASVMQTLDREADFGGFTESRRINPETDLPPGWSGWRGDRPGNQDNIECLTVFRDSLYEPVVWPSGGLMRGDYQLTKLKFKTGRGDVKHGLWITWEVRRHIPTGRVVLSGVLHSAASVQRKNWWNWAQAKRVAAAQASFLKIPRFLRIFRAHVDDVVIRIDSNLDVLNPNWARYINALFVGTNCRVRIPERGTHRQSGRAIDIRITNMSAASAKTRVLDDSLPELDHKRTIDFLTPQAPLFTNRGNLNKALAHLSRQNKRTRRRRKKRR